MTITVVVGGQYGSEGKGKMAAHLCREEGFRAAVRCGGPNSGHTIQLGGERAVLRQVPAGAEVKGVRLFLAAGCLVDPEVLLDEIDLLGLEPREIAVDGNAFIIEPRHKQREIEGSFEERVGSTCSGTGAALAERILRTGEGRLAGEVPELAPYTRPVSEELLELLRWKEGIVLEGTQGFALSLYHTPHYPFATSRDTTAAAFLSEAGLPPLLVERVVLVLRTFPIRVGGNSGPLPREISWEALRRESGYPGEVRELTSVTRRVRRVARFDLEMAARASRVNGATEIALMGSDYLDHGNLGSERYGELSAGTRAFVERLEAKTSVPVRYIGTGPGGLDLIDRGARPGSRSIFRAGS